MDIDNTVSDMKFYLNDVFKEIKIKISPYVHTNTNLIINNYYTQLYDKSDNSIPENYSIDNIINIVLNDYLEDHNEISYEEIKAILLRIFINIILETEYMQNIDTRDINLDNYQLNTNKPEDLGKMIFLGNNKNIIGTLLLTGTSELLYRDISKSLNLNIYPMNEDEYIFLLQTKKLLNDNPELLIKGNLNAIFNSLGSSYKETYLLNEIKFYLKNMSNEEIEELNLTDNQKQLLFTDLNIIVPNSVNVKQNKEIEKAKNCMYLDKVNYIEKDNTKYIKLRDEINDEYVFAEVVGNITPQERIEKVKNGISNLPNNQIIKVDSITNDIKKDMIINGKFENVNNKKIKEKGIGEEMKFDTKTGIMVDKDGNAYDMNINQNGNVQVNKLTNNENKDSYIIGNVDDQIIGQLKKYGVSTEQYLNATEKQQRQIRDLYGIGKMDDNTHNINKENTDVKTYTKKLPKMNGYISSFIISFMIGVFGGVLAMIIMSISK